MISDMGWFDTKTNSLMKIEVEMTMHVILLKEWLFTHESIMRVKNIHPKARVSVDLKTTKCKYKIDTSSTDPKVPGLLSFVVPEEVVRHMPV